MIKKSIGVTILLAWVLTIASETYSVKAIVVHAGCNDYFVADGPTGYYLLEWYGGHIPSKGDTLVGDIASYGFKDVYYPEYDSEGKVWVDDYLLAKSTVIEKLKEKCN
jgi:hypothetical protein